MALLRKKQKPQEQRRRPVDSSPRVFSYYARSGTTQPQNSARERVSDTSAPKRRLPLLQLRFGHLPTYLALIVIIGALLNALWLQTSPKIVLVQSPNTIHRDPQQYTKLIGQVWKRSPLNRTKLTVQTGRIHRDILAQLPEVASAKIELPLLGHRPTIIITPAQPALQLVSVNGSTYVDANGKVMAKASDVTQNVLEIPTIQDESGLAANPGKVVLLQSEVAFLVNLNAQLKAENVSVTSLVLPSATANEVDVRFPDQSYYVKFATDSDARQAVGSYLAAKAKLDDQRVTPKEYIDVRVSEKVFYK